MKKIITISLLLFSTTLFARTLAFMCLGVHKLSGDQLMFEIHIPSMESDNMYELRLTQYGSFETYTRMRFPISNVEMKKIDGNFQFSYKVEDSDRFFYLTMPKGQTAPDTLDFNLGHNGMEILSLGQGFDCHLFF